MTPFSTLKIWRVAGKPIRGSVTKRTNLSSSENWTHLTAVLNSHDFKHFPFETSQSLAVLSADPETKRVLEAKRLYARVRVHGESLRSSLLGGRTRYLSCCIMLRRAASPCGSSSLFIRRKTINLVAWLRLRIVVSSLQGFLINNGRSANSSPCPAASPFWNASILREDRTLLA